MGMKKQIIKIFYIIAVFVATLLIYGSVFNKETVDITRQMDGATLPVMTLVSQGDEVNTLHGYTREMEVNYMRGTIMPLQENRRLSLKMYCFGTTPENLRFEVRTIDGTSLVEATDIDALSEDESSDTLTASIQVKDLIISDTEYMLVLLADVNGQTVRYYTRIVWTQSDEGYHAEEEIDFIRDFRNKSFNKTQAESLSTYMETNDQGDNSTLAKVDIHSRLSQVSWGDLEITGRTEPEIFIKDLHAQTGSYVMTYRVDARGDDGITRTYDIKEKYRVRYSSERIYLLDFDREMNYVFTGGEEDYEDGALNLSITDPEFQITENDGGDAFAFVSADRLFVYNVTEQSLALLFGFYDENHEDVRDLWKKNEIKILNVDEAGNVEFLVTGYMNRGQHEGEVGSAVYAYDASVNTIEEKAFLAETKSEEIIIAYADALSYSNLSEDFYIMHDDKIYSVNLNERTYKIVIDHIADSQYKISDSGSLILWQGQEADKLSLMDFNSEKKTEIQAGFGEGIVPIGFIGEDLVCGFYRVEDIYEDRTGNQIYPMYRIEIRDKDENLLKKYEVDDTYVIQAEITDQQIQLTRVTFNENGEAVAAVADQIMSTVEEASTSSKVTLTATETMENTIRIAFKNSQSDKTPGLLTPSEIMYEGNRDLEIEEQEEETRTRLYYVYDQDGVEGFYSRVAEAVSHASDASGVVLDSDNTYIWIKGNLQTKNQIMSITYAMTDVDRSGEDSLAVCLDLMLQQQGISQNVNAMLEEGDSPLDILQESLPGAQILDLGGCPLNSMLYYVNRDIPVLALKNDGSAVLIIGFNELNTVLLDPSLGTASVYKYGMNDSKTLFDNNANRFITFLMPEDEK